MLTRTERKSMLWTPEQDDLLLAEYGEVPTAELMRKLGRSYGAIAQRIKYLREKEYRKCRK